MRRVYSNLLTWASVLALVFGFILGTGALRGEEPRDDEREEAVRCISNPDKIGIYCVEGNSDCTPRNCPENAS